MLVEQRGEGGSEVVQGPGDDHVVVEADANRDEEHGEADACGKQEWRRHMKTFLGKCEPLNTNS